MPGFEQARDAGELLEWAEVFDHFYGTPLKPVERALDSGELVILEIDVEGATQVKQIIKDAYAVFVLPPSEDALLDRLRERGRDDDAAIQHRFNKAKLEIARAEASGVYDRFLVNDNLSQAMGTAIELVEGELEQRCAGG